jgi:hypothetical protein
LEEALRLAGASATYRLEVGQGVTIEQDDAG